MLSATLFTPSCCAIFAASPVIASVGRPLVSRTTSKSTQRAAPPARPQRLHRRLFCRKPPRIPFILILEPLAVLALPCRVHSPQKYFAMALNRPSNSVHLSNVHAHSNDQDASSRAAFGQSAHPDYTVRVVAPTKTLKPKRKLPPVGKTFLFVSSSQSNSKWIQRKAQDIQILQVTALAKLPWLIHGFSTKPGGVSNQDGEKVLNLGFTEWDSRGYVMENRRRFQSALDASDLKLISLKQIHSDVIHLFEEAPAEPCNGDASITSRPGLLLGVQTADCVPILLVDPKKRVVAAVHAGWRGTLQRIVA